MLHIRPLLLASVLILGGCTHLKGVVVSEPGQRPHPNAVLSVGKPGGFVATESHPVDKKGEFDFYLMPTDENRVYLYDAANPDATMRRLDRSEFSEKMKLHLRPPAADPFPGMSVPQ